MGDIDLNTSVNTGMGTIPVNYEMDFSIPMAMVAVRIPITEWGGRLAEDKKSQIGSPERRIGSGTERTPLDDGSPTGGFELA